MLEARIGYASEQGQRESNDDFALACEPDDMARATREIVAVIADGMSGPGGRLAAETTARGFLDGYLGLPMTLGVDRACSQALAAMNHWIRAQAQRDSGLRGMGTTFSALVLRGRRAHVMHVGDTRIYRLRDGHLQCLTTDHTHNHPDMRHVLYRAVGLEDILRADYAAHELRPHDRFLLCCDGVHATLNDARLLDLLAERSEPEAAARRVVDTALEAGSRDNVTALVVDVVAVPTADRVDLETSMARLPILDLPAAGDMVDGFRLQEAISDGRYSRLFRAEDTVEPRSVTLKFPHPRVASEAAYQRAFVREAWVAAQVRSPFVGEVVELVAGRQSRLYSVMPYYPGETLEQRLRRAPPLTLEQGVRLGIQLAKAVYSLNRRNIIHRDVKPENVIMDIPGDGLRLLDLGVARLPAMEGDANEDIPGTPSYMAPELFEGHAGDERSDVYALGVTLYRVLSGGHYPYGEVEAFSRPRFSRRVPLTRYRADIPVWVDVLLARATAVNPAERYADAMELAFDLEHGQLHGTRVIARRMSLYDRNPLRFWQGVSLLLLIALVVVLANG